jgi:hypothetical protein
MISKCRYCCHFFDVVSSFLADAVMVDVVDDAFFVISVAGIIVVLINVKLCDVAAAEYVVIDVI